MERENRDLDREGEEKCPENPALLSRIQVKLVKSLYVEGVIAWCFEVREK
jgi:hypothetical protein